MAPSALLELPPDLVPTVVLDLETTGLEVEEGHRIIEVAAVCVDGPVERIVHSLVAPGRDIPADSFAVHRIGPSLLAEAPPVSALLDPLRAEVDGRVLVAHNAAFDLGFLAAACERAGVPPLEPAAVVDTLTLAREVFGMHRCGLAALVERIGIAHDQPHRALSDAQATLGLYRAMIDALGDDAATLGQLLRLPAQLRRGGTRRQQVLGLIRAAARDGSRVAIDYTSGAGGALTTRRTITVTKLRPPYVEAWCHLRQDDRVFKLSRIRRAWPVAAPAPVDPPAELPVCSPET